MGKQARGEGRRKKAINELLKPGEVVVNSDGSCLFQIRIVQEDNKRTFKPVCKIHNTDKCYYNLKK